MDDQVMTARQGHLWIKHYGLWFRVLAVFDNDDKANAYMSQHDNAAALVTHGDFVFIADKADAGHPAPNL